MTSIGQEKANAILPHHGDGDLDFWEIKSIWGLMNERKLILITSILVLCNTITTFLRHNSCLAANLHRSSQQANLNKHAIRPVPNKHSYKQNGHLTYSRSSQNPPTKKGSLLLVCTW